MVVVRHARRAKIEGVLRYPDILQPPRLWFIGKRAYDLTPWLARHPGGQQALLQAEGTDCTELFRSYHLMKEPLERIFARFEVQLDPTDPLYLERSAGSHFTFTGDEFYRTVQSRVREYFLATKQRPGARRGHQILAFLLLCSAVLLVVPAFIFGSIPAALFLALAKTLGAVGPGHSTSHYSLFPRGRWNMLAFRFFSPFLVSSSPIWNAWHIQSHHIDTLTKGDLQDNYPVKRIQPAHPHRAWHRGQHFYIWIIYLLGLQLWSLQDFLVSASSFFTARFSPVRFPFWQRVESMLVIGFNLVFSVGLPFIFLDWRRALLVCLLANIPSSFFVVIQIVVNHEVPETMSQITADKPIDWGEHQVRTSHNFAPDSLLALHCSGGLNMQIEHHLFPGVHYTHFPEVKKIVQAACVEFGLPYNSSRTLFEAMGKHYRILRLNSVP